MSLFLSLKKYLLLSQSVHGGAGGGPGCVGGGGGVFSKVEMGDSDVVSNRRNQYSTVPYDDDDDVIMYE